MVMEHAHHEYLFDYRCKDLETGKLNIDKLTTLNTDSLCLTDMMEPGKEPSYEYCMQMERQHQKAEDLRTYVTREQRSLYEVKKQEEMRERQRQKDLEARRISELEKAHRLREIDRQEKIQELEEYRIRLQQREEELIKERQKRLAAQQNGTYIISSVGWQARKRRV